ncbi:MAG: hypothetical protein KGY70_10950, partial [Bacteroidales bacterium]|nr:hypothetical protein [Bacteroidales bacterium]
KIHIGTEHENPVTLYSHDAHRRKGKLIWAIHVAREGKYEIRLNHWPEESGKRIVENGNGNKELPVEQANLLLGTLDSARQVTPDMTTAKFVMNLKAGETAIQTSLDLKNSDNTLSTRCVYVEYLGEPNEEALQDYASVDPDMYLRKIMKNK